MKNNEPSESDKKIAELLNIEPDKTENLPSQIENQQQIENKPVSATGDSDLDYTSVRQNLKKLILTSEIAIEGILNVANEGDSPRAYEVVSDLIKTALDANNRLMELHKTVKDIKKEEAKPAKGDTVTNNSIFVGNTTDLLKMLKQKKLPVVDAEKITTEDAKDSK
jgi:hypothetical protein